MINFIHTADIHFGMENYGRIDSATGIHSRLLDFEKALNFCIDYAIEKKVDFFLFAGDAYKTAHPTPTHQRLLMRCLLKLYKAEIPIVLVVGNHDHPLSFGKAHALEVFGQVPINGFNVISKPSILNLETKNGPIQIVGIPWPTRNTVALKTQNIQIPASEITQYISKGVNAIIKDLASQLNFQIPAVLSGHLTVSTGIFSGSEKRAIYGNDPVFLPSQLAIEPFDYVALGHLHRFQELNQNGFPPVIYSGSIERIDFGERKEEKGFCHVKIENKGMTTYQFIKTPTRPFLQIEIFLKAEQNHTQFIIEELAKYNINGAIIKIIYHIPSGIRDKVDIAAIQLFCANAWYIVGIIPVRIPEIKERRTSLKVSMNLHELLDSYFSSKPEYKTKKNILVEKTLKLQAEMQEQET